MILALPFANARGGLHAFDDFAMFQPPPQKNMVAPCHFFEFKVGCKPTHHDLVFEKMWKTLKYGYGRISPLFWVVLQLQQQFRADEHILSVLHKHVGNVWWSRSRVVTRSRGVAVTCEHVSGQACPIPGPHLTFVLIVWVILLKLVLSR